MSPATDPRQHLAQHARRIVVKVGSRLLADSAGSTAEQRIQDLVAQLTLLRDRFEVILVTSGAIAMGMRRLDLTTRPRDLPTLQALAAVGQAHLMTLYERACTARGFHSAQILLSADDVRDRKRHLNIRNTLHALLQRHILPIINENDTVSVDEIRFGDNDTLAAFVATMARADVTVLLTTIDGLHTRLPDGSLGDRIPTVTLIDDTLRAMASGTDGNPYSTGGMLTKLDAAQICLTAGEYLYMADGTDFTILQRLFSGHDLGTLFVPDADRMTAAKRYLTFFADPVGSVRVDPGAVRAITQSGKSLLPTGITAVEGEFDKGDTIEILTADGHPIAVGISNYAATDVERIKGQHSSQIDTLLGRTGYPEVIHRNNLALVSPGNSTIILSRATPRPR